MFIQVIEGHTERPEEVHERLEIWQRDLMPTAIGYLGSTGGCTSSGDCILIARFESRDAAQQNSDRPEQGEWWEETEKLFDGPVRFHDTDDVQLMTHGEMDSAHFVQVMEGHVSNPRRLAELERESDPILAELRPDLLGSVTGYFGDDEFVEVAYFTSEAEARRAEQRDMPDQMASKFAEWERLMKVEKYIDISDPWLVSA
jgi:hypothetical protein